MKEFDQKPNELTVIKGQMVNVISNLQSKHQLGEIMPLLNLLKKLENYINSTNGLEHNRNGELNILYTKLNLGTQIVGITEKISFLISRIHIESAYLESIKKSMVFGVKNHYKRKEINNFLHQKTYALEKKRLFILTLKLILLDHKDINTTAMNLDFLTNLLLENMESGIGSLINLIKNSCKICGAVSTQQSSSKISLNHDQSLLKKPDQFCFCKVLTINPIQMPHFSGFICFKLSGFMGIYESDYLDKILTENAPGLVADQFNQSFCSKQHKRRTVVIVKDQQVFSEPMAPQSLMLSSQMSILKAREIEIQVWEIAGKHDRLVAVAIVPLYSLLETQKVIGQKNCGGGEKEEELKPRTIYLEPAGFVMCQMKLYEASSLAIPSEVGLGAKDDAYQPPTTVINMNENTNSNNKENFVTMPSNVCKKFGLKRRGNIFAKLGGYRVARYTEANVPVSVWTDWFQNHIDRLAVEVRSENQTTADHRRDIFCKDIRHEVINSSFCSKPIEKLPQTPLIKKPSIRPTPKLSQRNPRAVCQFINFDKEPLSEKRDNFSSLAFVSALRSQPASTPITNKIRNSQTVLSPNGFLQHPLPPPSPFADERSRSILADGILCSPRKYFNVALTPAKTSRQQLSKIMENRSVNESCNRDCDRQNELNKSMSQSNIVLQQSFTSYRHPLNRTTKSLGCSESDSESDDDQNTHFDIDGHSNRDFSICGLSRRNDMSYGGKAVHILSRSLMDCSVVSLSGSRNVVPLACSPELQNLPVCKIDSSMFGQSLIKSSKTTCSVVKSQSNQKKSLLCESKTDKMSVKEEPSHDWGSPFYDDRSCNSTSELVVPPEYRSLINDTNDQNDRSDKSFWDENENEDSDEDEEEEEEEEVERDVEVDLPRLKTNKSQQITKAGDKWSSNDFELICVLGMGNFGKVLLARENRNGTLCAIKSIQKCRASREGEYLSLQSEKKILTLIKESKCPFLIGLIGCFQTERYLLIAMEYAAGGDLMGHIHNNLFKEEQARFYIACVVLAFEFLHGKDIIYRDLKLENVLMDHQGYAKLTDFGLSKENMKWDDYTTTFCGTPEFLAPEIISVQEYTRAVDWWALGVLVYQMMLGETPFPGSEDDEIFHNILETFPDTSGLSSTNLSFVTALLEHKPNQRLGYGENGARDVKAHPFFDNIDWDRLYQRQVKCPFVPHLDFPADTQYFETEFTSLAVSVEHDRPSDDKKIRNHLFLDFDTSVF